MGKGTADAQVQVGVERVKVNRVGVERVGVQGST